MKRQVKLQLSRRSVADLISLGKTVAGAMKNNDLFPNPPVTPDELMEAANELMKVNVEVLKTNSIMSFAVQRNRKEELIKMLEQLGSYVNFISDGNEIIIRAAGMPMRDLPGRSPRPEQPVGIEARFTGIPQTVLVQWKRPKHAKMFRVLISENPDDNNSWQVYDTIITRKLMVKGLASGRKYFFRVVPVGTAGEGPQSEVAYMVTV